MARAVAGPLVIGVSGQLGGAVFLQRGARQLVQRRGAKIDPFTLPQFACRYRFDAASVLWRELSADAKLQWQTLASNLQRNLRGDEARSMSGRNLFATTQLRLLNSEYATINDVPERAGRPQLASMEATYAGGVLELDYSKSAAANVGMISIRGCRSMSLSGFKRRAYLTLVGADYAASGTIDLTSRFADRLGFPVVGEWISLEVRAKEDNGLFSGPWRMDLQRAS